MSDLGHPYAVEAASDPDSLRGKLSRSARMLIENETEEAPLIGYVNVAVYSDGTYSLGFQCPEDHPFLGPTLFTAYVKEVIEREMTGQMAADDYARENLL